MPARGLERLNADPIASQHRVATPSKLFLCCA
jgi:hypothetical protein